MTRKVPGRSAARVRLRFDKVALRLIADIRAALDKQVPRGKTVIFTVTAPVRLASKTASAISSEIIRMQETGQDATAQTVHGNQVQIRIIKGRAGQAKVAGFVHNPETDPKLLLDPSAEIIAGVTRTDAGRLPKRHSRRSSLAHTLPAESWSHIADALELADPLRRRLPMWQDQRMP